MRRPHRGTRGPAPAAETNAAPAPPAADEPASPTGAGPYAEVVQPPDGFVPLDLDGAAQVTQPSHRPPGVPEIIVPRKVLETVDPMMLAPQAPSRPPPSKEIPVVCTLCGTRMHAAPERIGQTMQCPDCHTVNEIKPPKKPPKKRGPTLDGSTDYKLEVAAQRPAYRPVVAPRGDYEELAEFDPAQRPPGWSRPEGRSAAPSQSVSSQPATFQPAPSTATEEAEALPQDDYDDDDGEEIRVSAPVERLEIKPEIKPLPPPDPDDYMYDGKYDDGLIGDWADRKKGAHWKKAPLMIGIIGFLFYPEALLRLVLYSIGLGAMINLGWVTAAWAQSDDPSYKVLSMLLTVLTAGGLGVLATSFAAVLYTVVLDTANGNDKIEGWPDWSIFDWIANAIYFPAAAFVAGLPGSVFTIAMLSIGLDPIYGAYAVVAPLMLSWVVLFPLVLYSMLAEGTIAAPFSAATVKSLKEASDGWVFFYMYSFVMGLVGGAALAFTGSNYVLFRIMGAAGVVAMMLIYCRVLGRLMWYASEKMAKLERRRAAEE
jgi:hypothetical protein